MKQKTDAVDPKWKPMNITGCFLAYSKEGHPILVEMPDEPGATWIPIFTTTEKLEVEMATIKKQIIK